MKNYQERFSQSPITKLPLAAALLVFAPVILSLVVSAVRHRIGLIQPGESPIVPFLISALLNIATILVAGRWLRGKGARLIDVGLGDLRAADAVLGVCAAAVNILFVYPFSVLVVRVLGLGEIRDAINYSPSDAAALIGAIVLTGLLFPLFEEIIFRGYLLNLLGGKIGSLWLFGLLGAAAFAAVHLPRWGIGGALFIFLWALLPVGLFLVRRTIYSSLIMHIINNLFAYVFVPLFLLRH